MEQRKLIKLIAKLRDIETLNDFKDKIDCFEQLFKSADEEARKLMLSDFNRLIKEIADGLESIKEKKSGE